MIPCIFKAMIWTHINILIIEDIYRITQKQLNRTELLEINYQCHIQISMLGTLIHPPIWIMMQGNCSAFSFFSQSKIWKFIDRNTARLINRFHPYSITYASTGMETMTNLDQNPNIFCFRQQRQGDLANSSQYRSMTNGTSIQKR